MALDSTVKERPILFSGPMVRAILEGRKTQTRRVVKPPRGKLVWDLSRATNENVGYLKAPFFHPDDEEELRGRIWCPYGQEGDRLWVRETWAWSGIDEIQDDVWYRASPINVDGEWPPNVRWRPSIHMPRWASRILLEVTGVRVERVQDISGVDCLSEGFGPGGVNPKMGRRWASALCLGRDHFREAWDSINAKRGFGWDANPWVWVVEFRKVA
jgi:hypothetical protein